VAEKFNFEFYMSNKTDKTWRVMFAEIGKNIPVGSGMAPHFLQVVVSAEEPIAASVIAAERFRSHPLRVSTSGYVVVRITEHV
jgi:hypothetical protein